MKKLFLFVALCILNYSGYSQNKFYNVNMSYTSSVAFDGSTVLYGNGAEEYYATWINEDGDNIWTLNHAFQSGYKASMDQSYPIMSKAGLFVFHSGNEQGKGLFSQRSVDFIGRDRVFHRKEFGEEFSGYPIHYMAYERKLFVVAMDKSNDFSDDGLYKNQFQLFCYDADQEVLRKYPIEFIIEGDKIKSFWSPVRVEEDYLEFYRVILNEENVFLRYEFLKVSHEGKKISESVLSSPFVKSIPRPTFCRNHTGDVFVNEKIWTQTDFNGNVFLSRINTARLFYLDHEKRYVSCGFVNQQNSGSKNTRSGFYYLILKDDKSSDDFYEAENVPRFLEDKDLNKRMLPALIKFDFAFVADRQFIISLDLTDKKHYFVEFKPDHLISFTEGDPVSYHFNSPYLPISNGLIDNLKKMTEEIPDVKKRGSGPYDISSTESGYLLIKMYEDKTKVRLYTE